MSTEVGAGGRFDIFLDSVLCCVVKIGCCVVDIGCCVVKIGCCVVRAMGHSEDWLFCREFLCFAVRVLGHRTL